MKFLITRKLGDIIADVEPFKFLDKSQITGAEIMLSKPELMDKADIEVVKKKCEGLYLTAHLPFYDLNLASVDNHISDYSMSIMVKGLEFCRKLNIDRAIAHLGFNVKLAGKAAAKWKGKFFIQKEELETVASSNGVKIIWENTYEESFDLFDEIIQHDPDTLFCLDAGHCNCFAGFSAEDFLKRYKKNTVHLHLHDNDGTEDSHKAPGTGTIDFKGIMRLADGSIIKNAVLEINPEKYTFSKKIINDLIKAGEK